MKIIGIVVCALISIVNGGGVVPAATILSSPSHHTSIVKSSNAGDSFAYSTVARHASYIPITHSFFGHHQPLASISYAAHVPAGYVTAGGAAAAYPISYYHPSSSLLFQHPIFSQQFVTSPIFSPTPIIGQNPGVISQQPIFGGGVAPPSQVPIQQPSPPPSGNPIQQFPIAPPQPQPPQQPAGQPAPTPVQGTVLDDDTVAVDSATQ